MQSAQRRAQIINRKSQIVINIMKLALKIIGILVVVIILAMVSIPYFFSGQIVQKIKEEINKNVNAQVDFKDYSLSLFKSFPDFSLALEGLSVVGKEPFKGDTLAYIPKFSLTLDLMSVFKGSPYEIKKIALSEPVINALVKADGKANWDISMPAEEPAKVEQPEESGSFLIKLKDVTITNGRIFYDDKSLISSVLLTGVNHKLSGDFSMDFTSLKTKTTIKEMTVFYDGVKYFNKVDADLDAMIDADLKNFVFTLKENELRLNRLFVGFDGSVAMPNDDIIISLTYQSKKSDFKNFLSLVPAIYAKDFENVKTSGSLTLNGNCIGTYNDTNYPGFLLNLIVENGQFQYPALPKSVDNINIKTKIDFPGGTDFDKLVVDVSNFSFRMAGNPVAASLLLKTPMSDMQLKGRIDGQLNLSQVKEVYPLEAGDELSGKITAKLEFEGRMSAIETEKYDQFKALGSLLVEGMNYKSAALPGNVEIERAQLNFSPEYLDLVTFKMKLGKSDFAASGKIENFLPYTFSDGILLGRLQTSSSYFNVSELMPKSSDTTQVTDTAAMSVIEIPANIDFAMNANFREIIYDNMTLRNVTGDLAVKDKAVNLKNLNMEVLDGSMALSGIYDTKVIEKPTVDFAIVIQNIDIQQAYKTFGSMQKIAPIAEKTSGKFSTGFTIKTFLNSQMMPVYETTNGNGNLKTSAIVVKDVNTLNKLADLVKMPELKTMSLAPVDLSFEIISGKVFVKPFDIKYEDIKANIGGWTALDQTIDYTMKLTVPRARFGGAANSVLENLISEANKKGTNFSLGENIDLTVLIGGTLTDPQLKTGLGKGSGNSMMDDLKKKAQEELEKQKQKLEEEARKELENKKQQASKEADRIIADAEQQAQKILREAQIQADAINKTAQESAQQVKTEGEKQAKKLIDEGKKNGPIAEIAAKKGADITKKEANKKADQMVVEAKKKSDGIMQAARNQVEKIKLDAKEKASKSINGIKY